MIKTLQTKLNSKEVHCVNAKELKDILNIKTRLDKWIDSFIDRYSFKQGIDYKIDILNTKGRGAKSYIITISMAKLICANYNTQGKEIYIYLDELCNGIDKADTQHNIKIVDKHKSIKEIKSFLKEYQDISLDELKEISNIISSRIKYIVVDRLQRFRV